MYSIESYMESFPINSERIDVSKLGITLLTSLERFTKLLHLDLSGNELTSLPSLPKSLLTLNCYSNQLTALCNLPPFLKSLDCSANQLTSLSNLPSTLETLGCYCNNLVSLQIPKSLKLFYCWENQLTSLPDLPTSLIRLFCSENRLTSLPHLPNSLATLWVENNYLTSLPNFSTSLISLNCAKNPIGITTLQEYRNYDRFKTLYYTCKFGPKIRKFVATKRNKKFKQEFLEIIYSPNYSFYKQFLDPNTINWINKGKKEIFINPKS